MAFRSYPPQPRSWLGILGVLIALSSPLVQWLLGPWFKNTFAFPLDRFVSLWVFWIALLLSIYTRQCTSHLRLRCTTF